MPSTTARTTRSQAGISVVPSWTSSFPCPGPSTSTTWYPRTSAWLAHGQGHVRDARVVAVDQDDRRTTVPAAPVGAQEERAQPMVIEFDIERLGWRIRQRQCPLERAQLGVERRLQGGIDRLPEQQLEADARVHCARR